MMKLVLLSLFLVIAQWSWGQMASIIDPHANNGYFAIFNNKLYFGADHGQGYELWVYDGTNPPSLVADINSGSGSSNPRDLTVFNNKLYFGADHGINGAEVWVYDGTNPPSLVADIRSGSGASFPFFFTAVNNKLYFVADDGVHGKEIWVYDGTNPPSLVADIRSGSNHSLPWDLTAFNNKLYFRADNGIQGQEIWVYDGVNPPSIIELRPGSAGSGPGGFTVFNNKLYFYAFSVGFGFELWSYDGTTTPSLFADIRSGSNSSNPGFFTVFNNKLYFQADDGIHGKELWVYDGTNPPSVIDIRPGSASASPGYFAVLNNKLYFDVRGYSTALWVYDETNGASAIAGTGGTRPTSLTPFNNRLYFRGGGGPWVLWEYNPLPPPASIHVDQNATGNNDGTSWANAFTNLQEAIDSAQAGDSILVAQGNYLPSKNSMGIVTSGRDATYYINKDIIIQGGYPTGGGTRNPMMHQTILSGDLGTMGNTSDNAYHVLWLEGLSNTAILEGLVIQDGNANGTAYVDDWGAGILNNGTGTGNSSNPTLKNCIIRWNQASYMSGGLLNNSSHGGETSPTVVGCLFYENTASAGGAIGNVTFNGGTNTMLVSNCTFADNMGTGASIYSRNGNASIQVQNSILWDNMAVRNNTPANECIVSYSLVATGSLGASDGGNNILTSQGPLFIDAANDNYGIWDASIAIDKGSNGLVVSGLNTDLAGNTRIDNGTVDLGALETPMNTRVYVNHAATGSNDGTSWADACTDLQIALLKSRAGTAVWMAAGTYKPTNSTDRTISFKIGTDVLVYGGFAGGETSLNQRNWATNPTILSGDIGAMGNTNDNSYHVVTIENGTNTTLLDGLIIQEGNADGVNYIHNWGGGILNLGLGTGNSSNPTLMNCIIRWNHAAYMGGGLLNDGGNNGETSPILIGCLFYENTANTGGAAIANRTFSNGSNNMVITNSTFADNAGSGGSVYNRNGNANVTIQNSILWDMSPIYNFANETTVQYSSVMGTSLASGTTDGGNNQLATDPLFVDPVNDNYSLQASSPAIASGNNAYLPAGYTMDLANNARQIGTTVELGCYEDGASAARPELARAKTTNNTATAEQSMTIEEKLDGNTLMTKTVASMTVYPNPVQDIAHVNLKNVNQAATIRLLSTTGQLLHQEQIQADAQTVLQLSMGRLAKGIYLLNIKLEDGTQLNERVIKY